MAADPAQLESLEQRDTVPELPTATDIAGAYGQAAIHNLHEERRDRGRSGSAPSSPAMPSQNHPLTRQMSSSSRSSRVDIGFFDPEGVEQLRRTLSRQSETQSPHIAHAGPSGRGEGQSIHSGSTDETLSGSNDGPFDFEKTLRNLIKKYVLVYDWIRAALTCLQVGRV